jgi:hypothetical protein
MSAHHLCALDCTFYRIALPPVALRKGEASECVYAAYVKILDGPSRSKNYPALLHPLGPLFRHLPLSLRRHLLYLRAYRRWGNFNQPELWSEKMAWRVMNDERTILKMGADKLASKEYMRQIIATLGSAADCLIPETYWVGTSVRDLQDFEHQLPARWVLKPNHSCGRVVQVDSAKQPIDWDHLDQVTSRWLAPDEEVRVMGHQAYRGARPLLYVEQRIGGYETPPNDIRIFGFADRTGEVKIWEIQESTGSHTSAFTNYRFTAGFKRKESYHFRDGAANDATRIDSATEQVRNSLLEIGERALAPFDHVRVDFYLEARSLWFGELAVYPGAGLVTYGIEIDRERGALWQLPDLNAPDPREAEWRALLQGTPKGTLQK